MLDIEQVVAVLDVPSEPLTLIVAPLGPDAGRIDMNGLPAARTVKRA